jgi:hypothetical protein
MTMPGFFSRRRAFFSRKKVARWGQPAQKVSSRSGQRLPGDGPGRGKLRARQGGGGPQHAVRRQLPHPGQRAAGPAGKADAQLMSAGDGLQIPLQERVHLLQSQNLFGALQVPQDGLLRQRPDGGQAQQTHGIACAQAAESLLAVQPSGAAGHHQPPGMLGALVVVVGAGLKDLLDAVQLFQHGQVLIAHAHQPVPLAHGTQGPGLVRQGPQRHVAPPVAHPGGEADDDDLAQLLRQLEGIGDQVLGLLHVGGLQHGQIRGHGHEAGVEFVGAGVGAGVVGGHDHQSALHTVLRAAVQRVGHAQKAVLLDDADGARVGQGGADARLQRADLVGGPLGIKAALGGDFAQHAQNLGGRRAGV